jgi:hypothetical protein
MVVADSLRVVFIWHQSDVRGVEAFQVCMTREEIRTQGIKVTFNKLPTSFQKETIKAVRP